MTGKPYESRWRVRGTGALTAPEALGSVRELLA